MKLRNFLLLSFFSLLTLCFFLIFRNTSSPPSNNGSKFPLLKQQFVLTQRLFEVQYLLDSKSRSPLSSLEDLTNLRKEIKLLKFNLQSLSQQLIQLKVSPDFIYSDKKCQLLISEFDSLLNGLPLGKEEKLGSMIDYIQNFGFSIKPIQKVQAYSHHFLNQYSPSEKALTYEYLLRGVSLDKISYHLKEIQQIKSLLDSQDPSFLDTSHVKYKKLILIFLMLRGRESQQVAYKNALHIFQAEKEIQKMGISPEEAFLCAYFEKMYDFPRQSAIFLAKECINLPVYMKKFQYIVGYYLGKYGLTIDQVIPIIEKRESERMKFLKLAPVSITESYPIAYYYVVRGYTRIDAISAGKRYLELFSKGYSVGLSDLIVVYEIEEGYPEEVAFNKAQEEYQYYLQLLKDNKTSTCEATQKSAFRFRYNIPSSLLDQKMTLYFKLQKEGLNLSQMKSLIQENSLPLTSGATSQSPIEKDPIHT